MISATSAAPRHPVGDGTPVRLGYGLYQVPQVLAQADGDGEADFHLGAGLDHGVGVEAAVGPHRELTLGPGVAHPAQRLPQEMSRSPGGIGPAPPGDGPSAPHRCRQPRPAAGDSPAGRCSPGLDLAAGALLAQTISLADSGINIDGQGPVAGSGPSGPGPGQQFPAHPVQLPHVPPAEAAQEGA